MGNIRAKIQDVIEKRRKSFSDAENIEKKTDILTIMLLAAKQENESKDKEFEITDRLVIDETLTFLFAGHDTTSNLMSWCCYYLSNEETGKKVQEKMYEEVSRVLRNKKQIEELDFEKVIPELVYTKQVLKETLRLRPPVPGFIEREFSEDMTLHGHFFKKGTSVTPFMYVAHLNPKYWGDNASQFQPERWNNESTHGYENNFFYLPFAAGPRNCIGMKFAMQEATIIMSILVLFFSVERDIKQEVLMSFRGTMSPVDLHLFFRPRHENQ